jgi:chromosome segregation ATPase
LQRSSYRRSLGVLFAFHNLSKTPQKQVPGRASPQDYCDPARTLASTSRDGPSSAKDAARQKAIEEKEEQIRYFETKLRETRGRIQEKASALRALDSGHRSTEAMPHQLQARRAVMVRELTELQRDEYEWEWYVSTHTADLRKFLAGQ